MSLDFLTDDLLIKNNSFDAFIYRFNAFLYVIPNLLSFIPVDIYGCDFAATSGLTLIEILAVVPIAEASSLITKSSHSDSTLKQRILFYINFKT